MAVSRDPTSANHRRPAEFIRQPVALRPAATDPTQLPFPVGDSEFPIRERPVPVLPFATRTSTHSSAPDVQSHFRSRSSYARNRNAVEDWIDGQRAFLSFV